MTDNAERALERVKTKLMLLPTSRIVNSDSWDAVTLDTALSVVDEVVAELRETTRREQIIEHARARHDLVCNCDPRYVMSCPRMAAAILGATTAKED